MDDEFDRLIRGFLRFAGSTEITAESRLRDLGLDSMQEIELLFAIEDTYGFVVPDEKLNDTVFGTAGSLWQMIVEQRGQTVAD